MTGYDLLQHAAAWQFAAKNFAYYEIAWSKTSLQDQASANKRLCAAVAEGYRQQATAGETEEVG